MIFSSLSFIFRFMPAFLILYLIAPAKLKNAVILIGSLIFYSVGEPVYVFLMLASILANYGLALAIAGRKGSGSLRHVLMILCCFFNIGLLLFFKYGKFFTGIVNDITGAGINFPELLLPLGISFYTFQILSYVIDVYRGDVECEYNVIDLGAYMSMFPQLIAGPIVVYRDVRERLKSPEGRMTLEGFESGIEIFTIGLGSKVLLANRFGQLWDTMAEIGYSNVSTATGWIGVIAYTLQIYFDFNGYSLMAIGLGRILGFELPKNFDRPYTALSVTDFWRRWHMTLTYFFRNYLYIPLGGNRRGRVRTYINMLIVWCITGFWHGADWNFVIWGLYYFVFLSVERLLFNNKDGIFLHLIERIKAWLIGGARYRIVRGISHFFRHLYTLPIVAVGWAIFAITDLGQLGGFLSRIFAPVLGLATDGMELTAFSGIMYVWLLLGALFSTAIPGRIFEWLKKTPLAALLLLAIFWASVVQLSDGVYNPFIYFRF